MLFYVDAVCMAIDGWLTLDIRAGIMQHARVSEKFLVTKEIRQDGSYIIIGVGGLRYSRKIGPKIFYTSAS
jgi:hypothetical protein